MNGKTSKFLRKKQMGVGSLKKVLKKTWMELDHKTRGLWRSADDSSPTK